MIYPKYDNDGNIMTDDRYKEIFKLMEMLDAEKSPHEVEKNLDGWQVWYPKKYPDCVCDAIEHCGSYGAEDDLLEIMGLLTEDERAYDSVKGYMTAEEVFERIKTHFDGHFE